MKKNIEYHDDVPQSVKDLMGYSRYEFITGYTGKTWLYANIATPPVLKDSRFEEISLSTFENLSLEELRDWLTKEIEHPEYLSGKVRVDYNYEGNDAWFELQLTNEPSAEEKAIHEQIMARYNKEAAIFAELENIMHKYKIDADRKVKEQKKADLEQKIQKIQQQIAALEI